LPRRVIEYSTASSDHERLKIIIVEREGINKESLKKENRWTKKHQVLLRNGHSYEYLSKRA
jgi:hypothetical protein